MRLNDVPTKLQHRAKKQIAHCSYIWNKYVKQINIDGPPAFIVGCGHSGTSVLLAILGAHPRIYPVPYESSIATQDEELKFQQAVKQFDADTITAGKRRWVEKSPVHIHYIERIFEWIPNAKIIVIVRDGRDVASSIKDRNGSLEEAVNRWIRDNLTAKQHFDNPNVHVIKYESIITHFEDSISELLKFLGEEYYVEIKDYYKTKKTWYSKDTSKPASAFGENHAQHRNWQINQPLFDGRGKWKKLSPKELDYIYSVAGPLLTEFGYINID